MILDYIVKPLPGQVYPRFLADQGRYKHLPRTRVYKLYVKKTFRPLKTEGLIHCICEALSRRNAAAGNPFLFCIHFRIDYMTFGQSPPERPKHLIGQSKQRLSVVPCIEFFQGIR